MSRVIRYNFMGQMRRIILLLCMLPFWYLHIQSVRQAVSVLLLLLIQKVISGHSRHSVFYCDKIIIDG